MFSVSGDTVEAQTGQRPTLSLPRAFDFLSFVCLLVEPNNPDTQTVLSCCILFKKIYMYEKIQYILSNIFCLFVNQSQLYVQGSVKG